jgi:hypothetical protein
VSQGNWLSLTYNGQSYFSKPPLRFWISALTFRAFGVNEWTVRIVSAIFGLLTVLMLYLLGRRTYGERAAFLGALILLTSHQFLYNHCVRTGETDSMLIFFWTVGLLLLQLAVESRNRNLLFLAAASIGLCGMVKHLGFVPIVLSIAITWALLSGAWRSFSGSSWTLSVGITLAVALPWHLYQWMKNGMVFVRAYFLGEIVEKRLEAGGGGSGPTRSGPWASISTVARGFFPWSCLLPFAVLESITHSESRRRWLLPMLWLVVALGITIISGRKFTWYVLPAFPAAALLVGGLMDRFLENGGSILTRLSLVIGGLVAFASTTNAAFHNPFGSMARQSMLAVRFLSRFETPDSPRWWATVWVVAAIGLYLGLTSIASRIDVPKSIGSAGRWLWVCAIVGLATTIVVTPLKFSRTISPLHEMARAAEEELSDQEMLTVVLPGRKTRNPFFQFYFGERSLNRHPVSRLPVALASGHLVLTDVASLENAREPGVEALPALQPVMRARGLILVRAVGN